MSTVLADLVLIVHFLFVIFVIGGFAAIWVGAALGWQWVRDLRFRVAHLAAILFVAAESMAGVWCPLTVWEDALRGRTTETSFVERWIHSVLFYSFPEWVFTVAYTAFALAVAATFWWVPPRRRKRKQQEAPERPL